MHAGEVLRQVAVALVRDDDRGAGLGDQEVGARDADIGGDELLPEHLARLVDQRGRLGDVALRRQMLVDAAEIRLDLVARQVHGRADDVARRLVADLDEVLAQVRLDDLEAGFLQMGVERDLLGDHRLALGDGAGIGLAADALDEVAGFGGGRCPMHDAAGLRHLALELLQVEIEVGERVILDVLGGVAQRLELGQLGAGRRDAADVVHAHALHRLLQVGIAERARGLLLEGEALRLHVRPPIGGSSR